MIELYREINKPDGNPISLLPKYIPVCLLQDGVPDRLGNFLYKIEGEPSREVNHCSIYPLL